MNNTEYEHELIIPNESLSIKIFSFSAYNDFQIIPYHWHASAEIIYVRRGKLKVQMNEKKYILKSGDIIYINSKQIHSTQSTENNEVIVVQIPSNFFNKFTNNEIKPFAVHCNTLESEDQKNFDNIRKLLYKMYLYSERKDEAYNLKIYSLLFDLGYILYKYFRVEEYDIDIASQKYLDRLSDISDYIKSNYKEQITLQSVADEFNHSPQYLSKMFRKYTGTTFLTFLNTVRLNYAFKEVINTDYSILSIAEENGFANVKSFNKLFKETYGMTPTAYRKKIKN